MSDEPLVWHYGLMAERWAEFNNEAPNCRSSFIATR